MISVKPDFSPIKCPYKMGITGMLKVYNKIDPLITKTLLLHDRRL